jgi:lipoprotein-releasing system permease protein
MGYSFFVARRYFGAGRRSGFTTAITIISVMGVAVGVLALIVVLAVMNGFESEVIKRIIGTNAHVIVRNESGIRNLEETMAEIAALPHVEAVAPFVFSKAMIMSRDGTDALFVKGIVPELEGEVTDFRDYVKPAYFSFDKRESGLGRIVIGKEIAYGMNLAVGDTVLLARAELSDDVPFGISPEVERFIVGGFFDSGMYEYDASLGFLSLEDAQAFYGLEDRVTGLSVRLDDMYLAPEATTLIGEVMGSSLLVTNWIRMNRNLFTWMKMEKKVMFLILTLIIVVAAFNIAGTLIMIVMERTKDIGILKSMGATSRGVMRIFMMHGVMVGAVGTVIGVVGGLVLAFFVDRYKLIQLPGDVYFVETIPVQMELLDVLLVVGVALLISFAATLYPSWRASRLAPVEAIRYE